MQSLHYNNGSIKLTRERATIVSRWEANEVARWIGGLAGIQSDISEIFVKHNIDGVGLSLLLREDLIRMGITKLDQQLILMQSIDLLLTLVNRLSSETLALLFMRIHCAATTCYNLLKRPDDKEPSNNNSNVINSPEFYTSISNLSETILSTCHWLGRIPFIEYVEYIELRRKIIKVLVQIRVLIRNLKLADQINMPKSKLILEINELRTTAKSLIRQNKDSLFSSDCYLTRVHLRRPIKDDVNIEYTTMPDFTHVISSIETESLSFMGSGFMAINIGDEIIEINNQVVIGWDPKHFNDLLRTSTQSSEICLLVKKMPRHNDDEIYTKRLADGPQNPRRSRARGALERRKQQTQENRTMLLEQEGEIEVESEDETVYQSKRTSQIRREQHSSLPDLSESHSNSKTTYSTGDKPSPMKSSASTSSVSTVASSAILSPRSPNQMISKQKSIEQPQSASGNQSSPNVTPKTPRKTGFESYFSTLFRPRQDAKSVIADMNDHTNKDHPQLVNIKRIHSIHRQKSSTESSMSLQDDRTSSSSPVMSVSSMNKSGSQTNLQGMSSARSSFSNMFKPSDAAERFRTKRANTDSGVKHMVSRSDSKSDMSILSNSTLNSSIVTNKPPLNHSDSRKNSGSVERRRPKRTPSYKNISCNDLGKGDCEGFLYRYSPKGTISFVQWRLYWCVLKGGTLYVFKSKDDINQEIEIKLEGKNVSPAPEKRKYGFRIGDEGSTSREYFYCSTRDEMAKWMNKMGLAAINFNIDDSKIAGFNKGFVDSTEASPVTTPIIGGNSISSGKHQRIMHVSSQGESENESDKDSSSVSWQIFASHHSSSSDTGTSKDKDLLDQNNKQIDMSLMPRQTRSSSSTSLLSLPETQDNPMKPTSNRLRGQMSVAFPKGHHRTSSSPIRFPPAYEDDQENAYVQTAPRLSDSDSSNELSSQQIPVNSKTSTTNPTQERVQSAKNCTPLMLNSSGGFSTPTIALSPTSSTKSAPFSAPPIMPTSSLSQRPSNNSVFLPGEDDLSSRSSRSASYSFDRSRSSFEDQLSPVFQPENVHPLKNSVSSLSSTTSSQQHSPAIVRTAPLYISVYSTTPPVPNVKGTISSSAPPPTNDNNNNNDDEHHQSIFTQRSTSPPRPLVSKKPDQSNDIVKHAVTSSIQQTSPTTFFRHHPSTKEQQKR